MKKVILLAGITLALAVTVSAQTKVSKQIKVLDWLNTAVVDGNQVEGGLHSYVTWADLGTKLKTAHIKVGMVVTITGETDRNLNGSFRLKTWAVNAALPTLAEWEHVGDLIVVPTIEDRNALIDATKVSLSPGTTVVVQANAAAIPEAYIYAAGLFDANGDGTIDPVVTSAGTDLWYSLTGNANAGYVFVSQAALASNTVDLTKGVDKATAVAAGTSAAAPIAISVGAVANTRITSFPIGGVDFTLTNDATVPVVAIPATWNNPTFYVKDATTVPATTFQLTDCWVKSYQTIDGIKYQVWAVDNSFLNGSTDALTLQIR